MADALAGVLWTMNMRRDDSTLADYRSLASAVISDLDMIIGSHGSLMNYAKDNFPYARNEQHERFVSFVLDNGLQRRLTLYRRSVG